MRGSDTAQDEFVEQLVAITNTRIWRKLQNRSVLIGGHEKVDLSQFFTYDFIINEENVIRTSEVMYTAIKCHFSDSIKYLHESMYEPQKRSVFLRVLGRNLTLSITILLKMSDSIPSLKIIEPFLLKVFITIDLYINKIMQYETDNLNIKTKNKSVAIFTGAYDTDSDRNRMTLEDPYLTDSAIVYRMILQMLNLIERFTIENCVSNGSDASAFNDHYEDLINLMYQTHQFYAGFNNNASLKYNTNDALLETCYDTVYERRLSKSFKTLCHDYLLNFSVVRGKDRIPVSLKAMFSGSKDSYDVRVLYEYQDVVFKVLKKIVYAKFKECLYRSQPHGIDEESLSLLKTAHCPAELIDDFDFLIDVVESCEAKIARRIIEHKIDSLPEVKLTNALAYGNATMPLREVIESIVGVEFVQFWWVFNVLRYEAEKQSDFVYGMSLKPISDTVIHIDKNADVFSHLLDFKCAAINTIYHNVFRLRIAINEYLVHGVADREYTKLMFLKIRENNLCLSNHLSKVITKLSSNYFLFYNDDFLKILLVLIGNLENPVYTEFDCDNCNDHGSYNDYFLSKMEKLSRYGNFIVNLLNNYQICNCKLVNTERFIFNEFQSNEILNLDIFNSVLFLDVPIGGPEDSYNVSYYFLPRLSSSETHASSSERNNETSTVPIPQLFYNPNVFNDTALSALHVFTTLIHFNCFGNVKDFFAHTSGLQNHTLSLYYLVDYEKTVFKLILCSFYIAWVVVYDCFIGSLINTETHISEAQFNSVLEYMTYYLREFLSMEFPGFCETYLSTVKSVFHYYGLESEVIRPTSHAVLKAAMTNEVKRSGVFYVQDTFSNVKSAMLINGGYTQILNILSVAFKEYIKMLNDHLIFVN